MPVFEYRCRDCGKTLERLLKNRNEKPICDCGSTNLEKMLSSFAVSESGAVSAPACASGTCGLQSPCASGQCPL